MRSWRAPLALFRLRMTSGFGTVLSLLVRAVVVAGLAWGVTYGYVRYRVADAQANVNELINPGRFRFLTADALMDAAPRWAADYGVRTWRDQVRVRITDDGRSTRPRSGGSPEDRMLAEMGVMIGRAERGARIQVAVRVLVEASVLFIRHRAVVEGEVGAEREGGYRTSVPTDWDLPFAEDTRDDDEAGAGLPSMPSPLAPTLEALRVLKTTEGRLATALRGPALSAWTPTTVPAAGPLSQAAALRPGLGAATSALGPYVSGPGRAEVTSWLGDDGAQALEAFAQLAQYLDIVLATAARNGTDAGALVGPYWQRRLLVIADLEAALTARGVFPP